MRISDWSSDVCSSDLESAAQSLTLDAAIERAISASPEVVAGQATIDGARAEIDQAGVRPNPTLGVEAENFAGTGGFSVLEQRSEEHTSELQSLMRISYAVFCLKTKKSQRR